MVEWLNTDGTRFEPGDAFGFVYRIDCGNRSYVGKKQMWRYRKGKRYSAGWERYTGSSDELNADIKSGMPYTKTVLHTGRNKTELNYLEAKLQFELDVLRRPDRFYNKWIKVTVARRQLI